MYMKSAHIDFAQMFREIKSDLLVSSPFRLSRRRSCRGAYRFVLGNRPAYRQDGRGELGGSVPYQISRLVGRGVAEDLIDVEGEGAGGEIVHHEVDVRDCVRADGVGDGEAEDALDVVVLMQLM